MPSTRGMTFETGRLDRIVARMSDKAERLIAAEAQDIARRAMTNTVRVDTGTMRRGWTAQRVDRFRWRVGNSVFYAPFHEFGTSRLSASPMLGPAVEAGRRSLPRLARDLFRP